MKVVYLVISIILTACNTKDTETRDVADSVKNSIISHHKVNGDEIPTDPSLGVKTYSNARFKDVTVKKTGAHKFTIEGKGQIFEANFGWVVEDGHNELQKGFHMTDAGAPAWGNFKFSVEVRKERPNSTLTLILFESSPKDGSRQHELPIALQ